MVVREKAIHVELVKGSFLSGKQDGVAISARYGAKERLGMVLTCLRAPVLKRGTAKLLAKHSEEVGQILHIECYAHIANGQIRFGPLSTRREIKKMAWSITIGSKPPMH